jgi:hypothetical protein
MRVPSSILEYGEEHIKRRPNEHVPADQKRSLLKRVTRFDPRLIAHDEPSRYGKTENSPKSCQSKQAVRKRVQVETCGLQNPKQWECRNKGPNREKGKNQKPRKRFVNLMTQRNFGGH